MKPSELDNIEAEAARLILRLGYTSTELHEAIERAVDWIEAHPFAADYPERIQA